MTGYDSAVFDSGEHVTGPVLSDAEWRAGLAAWDRKAAERASEADPHPYPEPEDRGKATLSPMGDVEYVGDLIRPGRIVTWAAEEGSGKSFTVTGELALRLAVAGGDFAGTWPVLELGSVLVLSEMHADDDYAREEMILRALGRERHELIGGLYRLPLMTAAGGVPVLTDDGWRAYVTDWCRAAHIKLLVFDTATGATQVEPWGKAIQEVFRNVRVMLDELPELAVVLIVHCKKPSGRGRRAISDVLGEWGRWCDVVVLQENDGPLGERATLSTHKRVRQPRRIVATKRDGLLIEPMDIEGSAPKVAPELVIAAVAAEPGLSTKALAERLGIARSTVRGYAASIPEIVGIAGKRGAVTWHVANGGDELTAMSPPGGSDSDVARGDGVYRYATSTAMSPDSQVEESEADILEQLPLTAERDR